jgi:hypothetical protein
MVLAWKVPSWLVENKSCVSVVQESVGNFPIAKAQYLRNPADNQWSKDCGYEVGNGSLRHKGWPASRLPVKLSRRRLAEMVSAVQQGQKRKQESQARRVMANKIKVVSIYSQSTRTPA